MSHRCNIYIVPIKLKLFVFKKRYMKMQKSERYLYSASFILGATKKAFYIVSIHLALSLVGAFTSAIAQQNTDFVITEISLSTLNSPSSQRDGIAGGHAGAVTGQDRVRKPGNNKHLLLTGSQLDMLMPAWANSAKMPNHRIDSRIQSDTGMWYSHFGERWNIDENIFLDYDIRL